MWGFLLNRVVEKTSLRVNEGSCLRVRYDEMTCHLCENMCPETAIQLHENGITIDEQKCSSCGLCTHSCPTDVFWIDSESFVNYIRQLDNYNQVCFLCKKVNHKIENSFYLPCLKILTIEWFMLALLKKIHIQIFLDENMCNQCEIDWNMQGFQEWVHVWNEQFRHESHSVEVIDKIYSIEQQEKKTSRRDFLRIVPKKTTKQVASFMFDSFEKTTIRKKIPHSPKRDILKAFIEKYGEQNIHAKISEQIHVYDICTDEYCSLCGKCSVLCPTGALYEQMGSTEKTLFFDPIKCIGCSVCTRYCKHLYMKKANVIRLECCKTKMLTSKNQSACPRCGELKNADEPFCGDCHIQEKRKTLTLG